MIEAPYGFAGSFTAPHHAASLVGRDILRAGGSAVEAMVAAAAAIAVAYPHMNGLGGDAFWVIRRRGEAPVVISGAGRAARLATPAWFAERSLASIPFRGPHAVLTTPGAVASWALALERFGGERKLPLGELLAPAIALAGEGLAVAPHLAQCSAAKSAALADLPGFAEVNRPFNHVLRTGDRLIQPALAQTFERLAKAGLGDFYRGDIAQAHHCYLEAIGSPLRGDDLAGFAATVEAPVAVPLSVGKVYNVAPPSQGFATLLALGIFDRLEPGAPDGFDHLHGLVEATKIAYTLRNRHLGDPVSMTVDVREWFGPEWLTRAALSIDRQRATPWPEPSSPGDTVWMGAVDRDGTVVSFIQSLFWEYGSGVACPATGITFQNRGAGFSLQPGINQLAPGRRPFHTLNPGLAELADGRILAFGTQGGEGQPQTMMALFSRYAMFGQGLQQAIMAPRWLLGTTWETPTVSLKLESRFPIELVERLAAAGHLVEMVAPFDPMMGHAGAVALHANGLMEAATDPRSDGAAIAF